MHAILKRAIALSAVTSTALLLAACGSTEPAENVGDATVTELNATDAMEGSTNDAMTNTDAAMGDAGAMANNSTDAMAAEGNNAMAAENTTAPAETK